MKKRILFSIIFAILVTAVVALSDYVPDVIVTSSDGIWTDTRAYNTIDAAITAVGTNNRDIYIVRQEATTVLTIPSNASIHFFASGSIANTGQLTLNTRQIFAGDHQIFTGTGDIDFSPGSVIRSAWFSSAVEAFYRTTDDNITLVISKSAFITANRSVGNNVNLRWEAPNNRLTANAGYTLSNIKNIEAGNFQLFAGAGDFTFLDGSRLKLDWFARLRSAVNWISTSKVTLVISGTNTVDYNETVPEGVIIDLDSENGIFSISAGVTLTVEGEFICGRHQAVASTGTLSFEKIPDLIFPEWWYTGSGSWDTAIESAIRSASVTYLDSLNENQGGTVSLASKAYPVTDIITVDRPVRLLGSYVEISSGPSRASAAGTRIVSAINDVSKDVIELVGNSVVSDAIIGTSLENFAINCAGTERDGIRVSADGYIYELTLKNINIWHPGNNGITVTNDNDSFSYSTIENIKVFSAGNDSFNLETGYVNDEVLGNIIVGCRSHNATRYGLYLGIKGVHVDTFAEDFSGTAGIYLKNLQRNLFTNCQVEQGGGYGLVLDGSSNNTFINFTSSGNTGSNIYLTGTTRSNTFISTNINQVATEKHIEIDSSSRNNLWISTYFQETPDISDNGTRNMFLMNWDGTSTSEPNIGILNGSGAIGELSWSVYNIEFQEGFVNKTTTYTITEEDKYIFCNANGGPFTVTLPPVSNDLRGRDFIIKKIDGSANAVTVDADGAETIEGAASVSLSSQWDYVVVTCRGDYWLIIGQN